MAANIFGRYVWLIEQFSRYGRLTYEEVNGLWRKSGLSYGEDDNIPLRTFHNHRKDIFDIFDVDIACDIKGGYKYYIDNAEDLGKDNLRLWLIDSYTAMNQIQADSKLKGRILFENIPSGHKWLNIITEAMRNNQTLHITQNVIVERIRRLVEIDQKISIWYMHLTVFWIVSLQAEHLHLIRISTLMPISVAAVVSFTLTRNRLRL